MSIMTDVKEKTSSGRLGYEEAVARTEEDIRLLLKSAPAVLRGMTSHLAKAEGKMIRARALLVCALQRDDLIEPDAVKTAAAVELLHLATLVHDDIIDNAETRRGIAALHKKFGEKYAVLCGDWLFCAALDHVSNVNTPVGGQDAVNRSFTRYLTEVCLGEVRQNRNNHNYRLSEREYFRIIRGKTAALFEACFYAGFTLSGEDEALRDIYLEIGNNIGLIFQLADDCADYEATQKMTKKPVLSDYSQGVITLPLIYALKTDKTLSEKITAGMKPYELKAAVQASGGFQYTHKKINLLSKKTQSAIKFLDTGVVKTELLTGLLHKATGQAH